MTPFQAEVEAERRWPGWAAKADCDGEWYVVTLVPLAGSSAVGRISDKHVGRSRADFVEAIEALGSPTRARTKTRS